MDAGVKELEPVIGVRAACKALAVDRPGYYRRHRKSPPAPKPEGVPAVQARALTEVERKEVRRVLESPEHVDEAPATVYAKLLDEGVYLCSERTMYRVLHEHDEVKERRRQATHPAKVKPELIATKPNQVWSWDISKLRGPARWTWYYLYTILDIFSRYVVGWMLAHSENGRLAKALISNAVEQQGVVKDQLTIHADNGSPMVARPVVYLYAELGVIKSYSRPHTSNDNPYSESHFRTLKYRPELPDRFGSFEDAHAYCARFFSWYNDEHRHSGIGFHTPADVHYGRAEKIRQHRAEVLSAAYAAHPERFVRKAPVPPAIPVVSWINEPREEAPTAQ